jgi:hypothetical protein
MSKDNGADSNAMKTYETLGRVLSEISLEPVEDAGNTCYYIDFGAPHVPVSDAIAAVAVDTERLVFYINFGPPAPPERRDEVARFITYANWGLSIGNFEMDFDEGTVRFKSSIDFRMVVLPEQLIRNIILAAMNAVEIYAEAVIDVLGRGKSARQAFDEANAKQE